MRLFEPETKLRKVRKACNLTQAKLARRTGYSRETISRIESGQRKMSRAFRDILLREEVLGKHLPQEAGLGDAPAGWRNYRCYLARWIGKRSMADVAQAVGISISSVRKFERAEATPRGIVGTRHSANYWDVSEAYAKALGFDGVDDAEAYLEAKDITPWLKRIAQERGTEDRLKAARMPAPDY